MFFEISIESSPKVVEFIEDVNELAVLLGFKSGNLHFQTATKGGEKTFVQLGLEASERKDCSCI